MHKTAKKNIVTKYVDNTELKLHRFLASDLLGVFTMVSRSKFWVLPTFIC
jgi:hypothetical protein